MFRIPEVLAIVEALQEKAVSKSQFYIPKGKENAKEEGSELGEFPAQEGESKESLVFVEEGSLESEKDIISKLLMKSQSTRSSPNPLNVDPKQKSNKIFARFAVSPVMQPIKSSGLMKSKGTF